MLTLVSMRTSITFAAGKGSEIDRYEVYIEESLHAFGMGMTSKSPELDMMGRSQ